MRGKEYGGCSRKAVRVGRWTLLATSVLAWTGAAAGAEEPAADRARLETVVSRAEKVERSAQETAVATTIISEAQIARTFAQDLRDLSAQAPNVMLDPSGAFQSSAAFFIRGFGSSDVESATDPAVGVFIDGVYQARTSSALQDMLDIGSVEVLRGPQGTLFGRNTVAGAVLVEHRKPDPAGYSLNGAVLFGNYGRLDISSIVNVPLVGDKAALRVAFKSSNFDGFYRDYHTNEHVGGTDRITLLPSLRIMPNDNLDILVRGEFVRMRDDSYPVQSRQLCPADGAGDWNPLAGPLVPLLAYLSEGPGAARLCAREPKDLDLFVERNEAVGVGSDYDIWGITGEATYTVDGLGAFTYVGNYRKVEEDVYQDVDAAAVPAFFTHRQQWHRQTTHELRFASDFSDRFDLVAGFFYFNQRYTIENDYAGAIFDPNLGLAIAGSLGAPTGLTVADINEFAPAFGTATQRNWSWAAYTQGKARVFDRVSLVAGLRYSKERKDFVNCAPAAFNDPQQRVCNLDPSDPFRYNYFDSAVDLDPGRKNTWSNLSPKAGIEYQPWDNLLLFATWSRGFCSGGFDGRCGSAQTCQPYDEERLDSYEIGVKWDGLDDRLRVNLTLFRANYQNALVGVVRPALTNGAPETVTTNAGRARSQGVELEVSALPAEGLTLWSSLGYLDSGYQSFCADINGPEAVAPGDVAGALAASCNAGEAFQIPDGRWLIPTDNSYLPRVKSPKWSLSAGFAYELAVGNAGTVEFAGDWHYESRSSISPNGIPAGNIVGVVNYDGVLVSPYRDAHHIVNASVTWRDADDRYRISVFGKNLTNTTYLIDGLNIDGLFTRYNRNYPRTYGIEISFSL